MKKLFVILSTVVFISLSFGSIYATPVPDTGQTKCYDNSTKLNPCPSPGEPFYGQDGNYEINPHSYTDLGNGIVRDNVTGLEWEVKHNKDDTQNYSEPNDADNTYTWYDGYTGTPGPDNDTEDFINDLNAANYGGYNDWRLPTIKELSTLVDSSGGYYPRINPTYFPDTQKSCYWSSTDYAFNTLYAWEVSFDSGSVGVRYKSSINYYVRAVRAGQYGSLDNLVINGDGTVTDNATGLMWQQATAPDTYTWEQALVYCEGLELAGYSDWRLPNRNELQSIVDYSTHSPSINTTYFPNTQASDYCSSTTIVRGLYVRTAWYVDFRKGKVISYDKSYYDYVRAVRAGQCGSLGDLDLDGICDDGDDSTVAGDNPCTGGNTVFCDDNCPDVSNADQADSDGDGVGDVCEETLIELSAFEAVAGNRDVSLIWSTASEIDNAGFNLYRAESGDGEFVKINSSLIPAQGSPPEGASYEFVDDDVQNRRVYWYMLEDVDLNGVTTMHGPVSATPKFFHWIGKQ